ncbi:unnamed protein product [Cuscuta epithymum]|uniref:RING-CH-type domain-containing protein n=1 Tax=Cuscuta epithymum TaxID=186058 RepID=A0AAV0G1Y9_9ASTE|nr:unnamed protein product [Cuscuta epithymum]
MGDHFVLLVDRLLTESTLEAAIQCGNSLQDPSSPFGDKRTDFSSHKMEINVNSSPAELVQCRICHEEDEDSNMDIPCSCLGSLKYAHHECVQKWCNEKGDNICEICCQQYKPSYTAPPPLLYYGGIPLHLRGFRGHWEISREDLSNPELSPTDPYNFINQQDSDEYSEHATQSLICCRFVAIIFTVLLMVRHTLPIFISVVGDDSMPLLEVLMLSIGIVLPIYIMVKAFIATRNRRRQHQDVRSSSDNAMTNEPPQLQQPLPHLIHIH